MRAQPIWLAGLAATGLISLFGLSNLLPKLEADLRASVTTSLATKGLLDKVKLSVSGQDVMITPLKDQKDVVSILDEAHSALRGLQSNAKAKSAWGWLSDPISMVSLNRPLNNVQAVASTNTITSAELPEVNDTAPASAVSSESMVASVSSSAAESLVAPPKLLDAKTQKAVSACEASIAHILEKSPVTFKFSGYQLTPSDKPIIAALTKAVNACPATFKFVVEGHSDSAGKPENTQIISLARAESVRNAIVVKGFDESRISFVGKGASEPIADNATFKGRLKNRRVTVKVTAE